MHFALSKEQQHILKTGIFRDFGEAKAPPGFQAGLSNCMYFSLSICSCCLLIWNFRVNSCTHEGFGSVW
jgi:hypothetical protein